MLCCQSTSNTKKNDMEILWTSGWMGGVGVDGCDLSEKCVRKYAIRCKETHLCS